MIYLILAISCSVLIANLIRMSQEKNARLFPTIAINYGIALIISYYLWDGEIKCHDIDIFLGFLNGILFFSGFICYFGALKSAGIATSVSIMRLAIAIPIIFGFFYFKDLLSLNRVIGIGMTFSALFLLSKFALKTHELRAFIWLGGLFATCGFADVINKFMNVYGHNKGVYLISIYGFSLLFSSIYLIIKREFPNLKEFIFGIFLGIPNQLTTLFTLMALKNIDSIVVFPTIGLGVLLGSVASDIIIWKESIDIEKWIAFIMASIAIILLNTA